MERVAKSWNTTAIALLAIAYVTVPFRGFPGTTLAATLVVASVVLVPLLLAAIAYRNPGRTVHGATYFMNLAVSVLAGALAITFAVAIGSAAAVPFLLLALVVVTPTMLNFWALRRRRAQPVPTADKHGPE